MKAKNPKELIKKMNITTEAVIIDQCGINNFSSFEMNGIKVKYIQSDEVGLSRSRNKALMHAGDKGICLIADDDLIYVDNYEELVKDAFDKNPEYDIIAFQVEGINRFFKSYHGKSRKLNYITSLKVSSVEIAFRIDKIKQKGIKFNELFGSGSIYRMGEENIFLYDCLRNGLKIKYIPVKLADLFIGDSTWFDGFNYKYFFDKGAVFTAMSRKWSLLLIFQFAFRHYKRYRREMSWFDSIQAMLKGRSDYISNYLGEK